MEEAGREKKSSTVAPDNLHRNVLQRRQLEGEILQKNTMDFHGLNLQQTLNYWLVVSTHLKNMSQLGNLPQKGVNIKHV